MAAGVPELHLQDVQNVCWCEWDKHVRVALEGGRLKKGFKPRGLVLTGSALADRLAELRADARARFAAGGITNLAWLDGAGPPPVGEQIALPF
jgi:hypothetical protein